MSEQRDAAMSANWDEHLHVLTRYACPCGAGGPLACDDDCPGDLRDPALIAAVCDLIQAIQRIESSHAEPLQ